LRKLLMGAVIASATFALAGGAVAQVSNGDATFDATLKKAKVGTPENPKSHTLRTVVTVNKPKTTVETIDLKLSAGLKFSGKGFPKCSEATIRNNPADCPAGSKAGPLGSASARLEPGDVALPFDVTPYVAGKNLFLFDVDSTTIDIRDILEGKITNEGRNLRITIPLALRQPLPGLDATLTGIDATFSGKKGDHAIVSSTKCKNGKFTVTGVLGFSARQDNAPVPAPETLKDKVKCTK
jgi:hypothetical protein